MSWICLTAAAGYQIVPVSTAHGDALTPLVSIRFVTRPLWSQRPRGTVNACMAVLTYIEAIPGPPTQLHQGGLSNSRFYHHSASR